MTPADGDWAVSRNPPNGEEHEWSEEPPTPEMLREFLMAHLSAMDAWRLGPDNLHHRNAAMAYGRALGRYLRGERLGAA